MPGILAAEEFSAQNLALVQGLNCGPEIWAIAASDWIANDCIPQMRRYRKNKTWLYFDGEELIGFGCLGRLKWPDPPGPKVEYSYIPQLGIKYQHRGGPRIQGVPKYSHQIMSHLVSNAYDHGTARLALRVHRDNHRGIALYRAFDFHEIEQEGDLIKMVRVMRDPNL
jgi:ribosomal protein S18 acetylase RimI-like enzyme